MQPRKVCKALRTPDRLKLDHHAAPLLVPSLNQNAAPKMTYSFTLMSFFSSTNTNNTLNGNVFGDVLLCP